MGTKDCSTSKSAPDALRALIRGAGLRGTAPRIAVLDRLGRADAPRSHAEIAADLVPRGFDRATIYRNLVDLAEAGLVTRIDLGDHVWRFELRTTERLHTSDHPHFVCVTCGSVACLSSVSVKIKPEPGSAGSALPEVSEVLLKGRCGRCRSTMGLLKPRASSRVPSRTFRRLL